MQIAIGAKSLGLTHSGDTWASATLAPDTAKCVDNGRAADAVASQSAVLLELGQRSNREGAVDAVDPATVEPETRQVGLQFSDVISP